MHALSQASPNRTKSVHCFFELVWSLKFFDNIDETPSLIDTTTISKARLKDIFLIRILGVVQYAQSIW